MTTLIIQGPTYFSPGDEDAFFRWLKSIPNVATVVGEGYDLLITLHHRNMPEDDLRELIGLFTRYQLDMTLLAQFASDENTSWLQDPTKNWYQPIFLGRPRHPREGWEEASENLMDEDINAIDDPWAQ